MPLFFLWRYIMDFQKLMQTGEGIESLKENLLDLDSEFRFKCRRCGKCCKHQNTILFNARDIFNIAKKLNMTTQQVIATCAEVYIGRNSKIPIVHMVPCGPKNACPLLADDGRCRVHDCKPTVCALFPLGRVMVKSNPEATSSSPEGMTVKYIINDITCGSAKKVNTVRSWLARFGIPEYDEFFYLWTDLITYLHRSICTLEKHACSDQTMNLIWNAFYSELYIHYDTSEEFMPQFKRNMDTLKKLCDGIEELDALVSGDGAPDDAGTSEAPGETDLLSVEQTKE